MRTLEHPGRPHLSSGLDDGTVMKLRESPVRPEHIVRSFLRVTSSDSSICRYSYSVRHVPDTSL